MENARQAEYCTMTRYIRPVESISFTGQEMLTSLLQAVHPATLTTINQLRGERKGVVRMTFRSEEAASDFDQRLASRKLHINGVRVAAVGDSGHFLRVTLLDVPEYLSSLDIERELRQYGSVAHVRREYIEYRGHRIENETRQVLFSHIARELPQRILIEGHCVFVTSRHSTLPRQRDDTTSNSLPNVSFPPPRPPSRQSAAPSASGTTSDTNVQATVTPSTPKHDPRVASPMVGTQTESLPPEIHSTRPSHVTASPKPYRRASICGPVAPAGKFSDEGRIQFRVEAQVQTDDIASSVNRWNNHSKTPSSQRKYYNFHEVRHAGRQDDFRSEYDCETKI